ncbi:MAG TPA: fatty acid cis/trans isomerase [Methylocella sp.]|nr:fatty acid cis/trans isomerase [Methylocella sp.]
MWEPIRRLRLVFVVFLLAGAVAAGLYAFQFWKEHGEADPTRYDSPAASAGPVSYREQIQPILERRCVVCHACYDAPCQLKLGSWEGIARGLSPDLVYNGSRLAEAPPTRLFVDAQKASEWRKRGFSPVLNEYRNTPEVNRSASLIYRILALKQAHPQPTAGLAPGDLDFSLDRKQSCPKIETFDLYEKTHPLAGMPFGLPGIAPADQEQIDRWIEQGAPDEGPPTLSGREEAEIAAWERFLNGNSLKERLMSRYLYEHLFLAHLYLNDAAGGPIFRLVRSATPPGQPVSDIAARRPFDAPNVERVYYRLQRDLEPIVAKTHMPYRLDMARMDRYRTLFLAPDYVVDREPFYAPREASNGLAAFRAIPMESRYRFLLDDAQYFVMTFIKGPVCRGQVALNVIDDRFWVFFLAPGVGVLKDADDVARRALEDMSLPAADGSNSVPLVTVWNGYAARERRFQAERATSLRAFAAFHGGPRLDMIWDGDGANPNAALTVMRHFDSATVVRGLVGEPPKTAWLLDYSLFERIYYLLVAGYDVYGNLTHNLNSRLYMDFLRMEGEANFISFLPASARADALSRWYRDATKESLDHMRALVADPEVESAVPYRGADPEQELLAMLGNHLRPVLDTRLSLANVTDADLREQLVRLAALRGESLGLMPELSYLVIRDSQGAMLYFTLVKDTGHRNVTHLLLEQNELAPEDNALTVVPGLIGAYPNAFFRLGQAELPEFIGAVASLKSEDDYRRLGDRFMVRRTDPRFWEFSDLLQAAEARMDQADRGLLDYNRLENR